MSNIPYNVGDILISSGNGEWYYRVEWIKKGHIGLIHVYKQTLKAPVGAHVMDYDYERVSPILKIHIPLILPPMETFL